MAVKRRKRTGMNMVERALVARDWQQKVATSRIHAIMGDSAQALVDQSGRVFYVVLVAALESGADMDLPEIRIIRGAINAVHEQAGEDPIDQLRRAAILNGLQAAVRLLDAIPYPAIVRAACDLETKLKLQDIGLKDFESLIAMFNRKSA